MALAPVIELLPNELLSQNIFTNFTSRELAGKISFVCRLWRDLADETSLSRLRALNCRVIDEADWRKHTPEEFLKGLTFSKSNYHYCVAKVRSYFASLRRHGLSAGKEGLTILAIPQELSINLLNAAFPDRLWIRSDILMDYGHRSIPAPYHILITNGFLEEINEEESDDHLSKTSPGFQQALVEKLDSTEPHVVEAIALAILTKKCFSVRLFQQKNVTCYELITERPITVGEDIRWNHGDGIAVHNGETQDFGCRTEISPLRKKQPQEESLFWRFINFVFQFPINFR